MLAFGINVSDSKNEDEDDSSCDEDDEELDDKWAKETISWWNQYVNLVLRRLSSDCGSSQVFGTKSAAEATVPARGSTLDTLLAKCKAQKQER